MRTKQPHRDATVRLFYILQAISPCVCSKSRMRFLRRLFKVTVFRSTNEKRPITAEGS